MIKTLKKLLCTMIVVVICVMAAPSQVSATEEDWLGYIPISTKEDLNAVRNNLSGKYYLTSDIIFTEEDFSENGTFYNDGKGWIPIGSESEPFSGMFDGNGYAIRGLQHQIEYVISEDTELAWGLFEYSSGKIMNLDLEEVSFKSKISSHPTYWYVSLSIDVGGVVVNNNGIIENCLVSGEFVEESVGAWPLAVVSIGGIANINNGKIIQCKNLSNISVTTNAGGPLCYIGGIVVTNTSSGVISQSKNIGVINGVIRSNDRDGAGIYSQAGGIASSNAGNITQCSNSEKITANIVPAKGSTSGTISYAGGISGNHTGEISNSYNVGQITASGASKSYAGGITGLQYFGSSSFHSGAIACCYNIGEIFANKHGGLVGCYWVSDSVLSDYDAIEDCCFLDTESFSIGDGAEYEYESQYGYKRNKEQMQNELWFWGFDFDTLWGMMPTGDYPYPVLKCPNEKHNWNDGTVTTHATCITAGVKTFTCIACGEVSDIQQEIPAKGHSADEDWTTISTSDTGKITQVKYCTDCGVVLQTREITQDITNPSDPTDHTEPVVDKGILGDVNGDGKVNIKDATLIQKAAAKIIELTDDEKLRADVNADNKNNVKDATAIQKFVAKIETGFPIGESIV